MTIEEEEERFIFSNNYISTIGVNRPAIVREIPHFGLFPAFPHFCENVPYFWLYFEVMKIAIILAARRHFVRKSSEKTSMIALPSY